MSMSRRASLLLLLALSVVCLSGTTAAAATTPPPPPGVPDRVVSPRSDAAQAATPLEDALDLIGPPNLNEFEHAVEISPGDLTESMRRYLKGRLARLRGDYTEAEQELKAAAALNPMAASPWRELGEMHLQAGERIAAAASFEQAARRDITDIRSVERTALHALERRDFTRAASLLGVIRRREQRVDPAVDFITNVRLGQALIELGYDAAGLEALRAGADLPPRFQEATAYSDDLSILYRQQSDLWRIAGEAALRLQRPADAASDFERALAYPSVNPDALVARQVYAWLLADEPNEALDRIIESVETRQGMVTPDAIELIRYATLHADLGDEIRARLDEIESGLTPARREVVSASLSLAKAAAADASDALAPLVERLDRAPADRQALGAAVSAASDASEIVRLVRTLTSQHPLEARQYVARILEVVPAETLRREAATAAKTPADALVNALLLEALGRVSEAAEALPEAIGDGRELDAALLLHRARLLHRLGESAAARKLAQGATPPSAEMHVARAAALLETFDRGGALDAARASLSTAPDDFLYRGRAHVIAADASVGRSDAEAAETHYEAAIASSPWLEEAYAGLVSLYAEDGPLNDDAKLIETVRRAREALPGSLVVDWFRVRDALRRRQYDIAERLLLDLHDQYPQNADVVSLLVTIWISTDRTDRAKAWLTERIERQPAEPVYAVRLADVHDELDAPREAAALLEQWLDARPGDSDVSERLETLYRESLSNPRRARELAMRRLNAMPQTSDVLLRQASILAVDREWDAAAGRIEQAAKRGSPPSPAEMGRFGRVLMEIASGALLSEDVEGADEARFCNDAIERFPRVPESAHLACIYLLSKSGAPVEQIINAVDRARTQYAGEDERFFDGAILDLRQRRRTADAVRLTARLADVLPALPDERLADWIVMALVGGSAEQLAAALDRVERNHDLAAFIERIPALIQLANNPPPAEIAYSLASKFVRTEDGDRARRLYRIALDFDPNHAWSNNNLGYRMLERGERVHEALTMIRRAHANMELEQASVVDSVGWGLYKVGEYDEAVEWLRRALDKSNRDSERQHRRLDYLEATVAIVEDHLGDALHMSGESAQAIEAWEAAGDRARAVRESLLERLAGADRSRNPDDVDSLRELLRETNSVIKATAAKLEAVRGGRTPPVAPSHPDAPKEAPADENAPPTRDADTIMGAVQESD